MRSIPTFAAAVLASALAASPAVAASSNGYMDTSTQGSASVPNGTWMSVSAIADQFTQQGYTVRSVEAEDGRYYEVEAIDANGMRVEAYVDPVTGQVLRQKHDD